MFKFMSFECLYRRGEGRDCTRTSESTPKAKEFRPKRRSVVSSRYCELCGGYYKVSYRIQTQKNYFFFKFTSI